MNKKEESEVLTKILEDRTPDNDAFGGHEQVAKAIYDLIQEEKEGGKAIALSGSYGSGKSTVVDFLKKRFQATNPKSKIETQIFIFDAWEHQGNPLRRAFIEKYIDFLRDEEVKWAEEDEWEEELELVSKHREEIETTSEPKITTLGGWFALSLLLLPLGLASVRLGIVDPPVMWLINTGFVLLFLPTLILLGIYICWRPIFPKHWIEIKEEHNLEDFKFWSKRFLKYIGYFLYHHRPDHHKKSIFNFVIKKSTDEIETTSLKSPDPTTIEFQKLFGKITKRVLRNEDRRLVIVIDNIDRLTTESSINAWTTLRTFFENDDKNWDWKKQFWLIAPFDFQELKNLWSGLDHLNNSGSNGSSEKTSEYVQAFIDKTFQVMFRVSKPVLSDWKEYFIKQLHIAFPNIREDTETVFNDIATLYQLKRIKKNESPTPRDIKQFINRVGALYRIWHEKDVKLSTLAFYEIVAEDKELVEKLKENTLADSTSMSIIDEKDLNRKLAAIHFNCEIDKAYQVLFGDQVATALQEGNSTNLKDYYEIDGFSDVLWSEFLLIMGQRVPLSLANCAICLNEIEEKNDFNLHKYFQKIAGSFNQVDAIKPVNENFGKGIAIIWEKTGFEENWITSILRKISNKEINDKEVAVKTWYSALEPIFESLQEQSLLHLLKDNLVLPGGADEYIKLLSLINNSETDFKKEITKYLQSNADQNEIVAAYSSLLKPDKISIDLGQALYLQSLAEEEMGVDEWDWNNLVSQIKSMIKVNSNHQPEQIEAALQIMLVLCFKFEDKNAIELSIDPNFKNGLFFLINNQNNESLLALITLSTILFNPSKEISVNDNNVNSGLNVLNKTLSKPGEKTFIKKDFINYLIEFQLLGDFLDIQQGFEKLRSFSKFIINHVFKSEKALELINAGIVFKHFDDLYQAVDEESLTSLIEDLYVHEQNLVGRIIEEFITVPSNYREHYYFAKACPDEYREQYFEFLAEGFRNIETEEWLEHLTNETKLIHLAIFIQEKGYELNSSTQLRKALFDHFKEVYNGQIELTSQELKSNWNVLIDSLKNNDKATLLRSMKDFIESDTNSDGSVSKFGEIYDSIFIENEIFLDGPERFVRTVFSRVLNKKNVDELKWLKSLIKNAPKILKKAGSDAESFTDEIKVIDTSDNPEAGDIIDEIAANLDIERNINKPGNDEGEEN